MKNKKKFGLYLFQSYFLSPTANSTVRTLGFISVLGITIGVFAFLTVLNIMGGFRNSIKDRHLKSDSHLNVTIPKNKQKELTNILKNIDNVKTFYKVQVQDVILKTFDDRFTGVQLKGLEGKKVLEWLNGISPEKQKFALEPLKENEVLLGQGLAKNLNILQGDELIVSPFENLLLPPGEIPTFSKVTVKKIFKTFVNNLDNKIILYNADTSFKNILSSASLQTFFETKLYDPNQVESVQEQLKDKGFSSQSWKERNSSLFYSLELEKFAMSLFLFLTSCISLLSIIIVITLIIFQKRKDIGILRAMGLPEENSKKIFLQMSLYLSAVGVFLGSLLSFLASLYLKNYSLDFLPNIYVDVKIPIEMNLGSLIFLLPMIFGLIFIISHYSIRSALKTQQPVELLKKF